MPAMNATGMNTAARMSAMPMTGRLHLGHRLEGRVARRHPLLDVVLDRLDDDDGVVDDQADRQHQPEQRQRVDREARAAGRRANAPTSETGTVSSGISVARQLCRKMKTTSTTRPIASSSVIENLLDARLHRRRGVERDLVVHARREALLELGHRRAHGCGDVERVRAGQLEGGDDAGRLAVERAVLRCS